MGIGSGPLQLARILERSPEACCNLFRHVQAEAFPSVPRINLSDHFAPQLAGATDHLQLGRRSEGLHAGVCRSVFRTVAIVSFTAFTAGGLLQLASTFLSPVLANEKPAQQKLKVCDVALVSVFHLTRPNCQ